MFEKVDLWYIECSTGCSCCDYENFTQGFYKEEEAAKEQVKQWLAGNGNPLGSQYAPKGRYYIRKGVGEILPDGRLILDNYKVYDENEWKNVGRIN